MGIALDYAGESIIAFDDDTYRWVSVKRFGLAGQGTVAAVLTALTGHPDYLDDGSEPRHGPYDALTITPDAFEAIGPDQVAELFEGLYRLHDCPPTPAVRDRVNAAAGPFRTAECYRLREMPEAVVLGGAFLDFQEVVGIDWEGRAVFLLVLAADV